MLLHRELRIVDASSGSISENTIKLNGLCRHIIIKPATSTTSYEFNITDFQDVIIYERDTETGTFTELIEMPLSGVYTMNITNATVDEEFIIQLILAE